MIKITDKSNCCGCYACVTACPTQCISMIPDMEGFLYPDVDKGNCLDCGLCRKVCNEISPFPAKEPIRVLAVLNKNEEIRKKSSSGGVFYTLSEKTIKQGGVVFGARFDEEWQVVIDYSEDMAGVEAFMGSKYVQARVDSAYKNVRCFLKNGRRVLFSGTPCQVAGLHKYLGKHYDNLLTVDFVCHGVPSPKVWGGYIGNKRQCLCNVEFRNKTLGWKNFCLRFDYFESGNYKSDIIPYDKDIYMKAFLNNLTLRPSCYHCRVKNNSSQSDVTLADFWGIQTAFPEMDDDMGTSLVIVNSTAGESALDLSQFVIRASTYECAKKLNPACFQSVKEHPKRKKFFRRVETMGVKAAMEDCVGKNGFLDLLKKSMCKICNVF